MLERLKAWWCANVGYYEEVEVDAAEWNRLKYATLAGVWACVRCGALVLEDFREAHMAQIHGGNVVQGPWH